MLKPETEDELAEAIRAADRPLRIMGGGTRGAAGEGTPLCTAAMSGVTLYEPGALTLIARAGTPLAEVEAVLAAENQALPFEPMDNRRVLGTEGEPTIGGAVAVNASGPRRITAGACRDCLIGVRFVDGTGTVVKNGGRVMKNVTGYDLVKLMAGSRGTLGVLTEVAFKVLPGAAASGDVVLRGLDAPRAVAAMAAAMGTPYGVSAAAHDPEAGETRLRIEGLEASVGYRLGRLREVLSSFGDVGIDTDGSRAAWAAIRDAVRFEGGAGDLWRISVAPSDGPRAVSALGQARWMMDWAGGLVWAETDPGRDLRAEINGLRGHATLVRAAPETHTRLSTFHLEPAPLAKIAEGLRARFDPRGLLNPGLMEPA